MIFDLISQEDDIASARKAAGIIEQPGSAKVIQRIVWRYFLAVWCLVGMAIGLKAAIIGALMIWILHPVLIGMRLSDLAKQNRVVRDSGQHNWFVSIGGISDKVKISSLKNVFFYSKEEMQTVLVSFCRLRFLLYAAALLAAFLDLYVQWQGVSENYSNLLAVAMVLANIIFLRNAAWPIIAY